MGSASFTLSDGRQFETEDIDGPGDLQAHHLVSDGVSVCYKMSKCGVPAAFDPGLQTYHGKLVAIEPPNRNISVQVHATERGYMIDGEIVADALVRARFLKLERYNDPVRTQQGPRKSTGSSAKARSYSGASGDRPTKKVKHLQTKAATKSAPPKRPAASAGNAAKKAKTTRGKRGGESFSKAKAKFQYHGLKYFSKLYAEIPKWMSKYPENVKDIEALAQQKGWDDFTVAEDVVERGEETQPYLLFGLNQNNRKVESFCTLDTEGALKYTGMPFDVGFTKIGNLLSLGTGDATAKGMIQYVEEVIQKAGNDMDKLIIADIEEDNTSSRRAFEVQGFQQQDSAKIQVKYGDTWGAYSAATPDECVLVSKQVEA
eukprot:COSAG06_NODE_6656_length_2839_cov_3.733577_1_plen_373_part_00